MLTDNELMNQLDNLENDIESTIRNGIVSADTKLITKALLFIGLQLHRLILDNCKIK